MMISGSEDKVLRLVGHRGSRNFSEERPRSDEKQAKNRESIFRSEASHATPSSFAVLLSSLRLTGDEHFKDVSLGAGNHGGVPKTIGFPMRGTNSVVHDNGPEGLLKSLLWDDPA